MTSIRSHFKPDKVEVKKGDVLYFHVTNLEQDFDVPHGFAIYGSTLPNLLIMPGQTKTMKWEAKEVGVFLSIALTSVLLFIRRCSSIYELARRKILCGLKINKSK